MNPFIPIRNFVAARYAHSALALRTALTIVVLLSAVLPMLCQAAPSAPDKGTRSIAGVLFNATTGRPIEGAMVTLSESYAESEDDAGPINRDTTTDAEGHFLFAHVPDGRFALRASHRGYIASDLDEHEGFSTAVVTGQGIDSTGIRFALKPQSVIYGTVMEDTGDPVPNATVRLYRRDTDTGKERIAGAGSTNADDLGHYEFSRLRPGNYFVVVTAKPWYATHPRGGHQQGATSPRSPLNVAYSTTYYPGTPDRNSATPIALKPGERVAANFALHAVPAMEISIQGSREMFGRGGQLQQEVFGEKQYVQAPVFVRAPNDESEAATVSIDGIAPGHYEFQALRSGSEPEIAYSIDASGESVVAHPETSGTSAVAVSGQVAMADGGSFPSGLHMRFRAKQDDVLTTVEVDADGSFHVDGLLPGDYEVVGAARGMAVGAIRMTASGATVSGNALKVGSTPVMMAAMLVASRAVVRGYATAHGNAAPGEMVVLVPSHPADHLERFRRDQSNSDGSFLFRNVVPGEYTVVAIQDGWDLEWSQPETIERFLAGGVKFTMRAKVGDIDLKTPVQVQAN